VAVLTLAEAKTHLNITADTYDAELATVVDAAESVLTARCGPLVSMAETRRVNAGGPELVLPSMPVVSLTSVTPVNGTVLPLTDLHLNTLTGVVRYNTGASFPVGAYDVVYEAGRTVLPDDLLYALKELTRHLWSSSQRGGSRRPGSEAMAANPATYLLPYAVQSLIEPHMIGPGVH